MAKLLEMDILSCKVKEKDLGLAKVSDKVRGLRLDMGLEICKGLAKEKAMGKDLGKLMGYDMEKDLEEKRMEI